jgi:CRISPR-associated protein Cas1
MVLAEATARSNRNNPTATTLPLHVNLGLHFGSPPSSPSVIAWLGETTMLRRIVEISGEGRRLSLNRGFLSIHGPEGLIGEVPLDDIEAVIAATPSVSYTNQAVAALAERGAPLAICGQDFKPVAWLLPVSGHHAQGIRMEAQAACPRSRKARLWAYLVKAKITAQAEALERASRPSAPLRRLLKDWRSDEATFVEAQAAQRYFPLLFGDTFRRDREADGINALLNYGYTVLRAATARAIIGAGLNPSLSLFHASRGEGLRLADDLMEPFRPTVDLLVLHLAEQGALDLSPAIKRELAAVLTSDFRSEIGVTTLSTAISKLAVSLAQAFTGDRPDLQFPSPLIPLLRTSEDEG